MGDQLNGHAGNDDGVTWREADRLSALARYKVMDTPTESEFDDVARLAAQICGTPTALISLLDDQRQWFKAKLGTTLTETPRSSAFCVHALQQSGVMEIRDATADERFADNPLVTGEEGIRFYAGAPIVTPDGFPLGTVCVLDQRPRELDDDQRQALAALARQVAALLELRRTLAQQRADQRRNQQILQSAVDYAIVSMDIAGVVTSWNEGACRILGWSADEMCGQHCDRFFTPEDRENGIPAQEMGNALREGRGIDERWHLRKDGERFWANGEMMPLTDEDDHPIGFIKVLRDRTVERRERERSEEHRLLLTGELQHRIKNTLTVVQAIVSQTLRSTSTPEAASEAIGDRLATLARAHDLLTQTSWKAAPIAAVVGGTITVLGGRAARVHADGPDLHLNARAALALSMALHELCTNAIKYGSLSNETGRVDVRWSTSVAGEEAIVTLTWQETGGPMVVSPGRKGFGSRLIEMSLRRDLGGKAVLEYLPEGVRWSLVSKREAIEEL